MGSSSPTSRLAESRLAVALASTLLLCAVACGSGEAPPAPAEAAAPAAGDRPQAPLAEIPESTDRTPVPIEWQDPEPEGAQALAEGMLAAAWNRDKTTGLEPLSTRLEMHITTLEYTTTALAGLSSQIEAEEATLEDRLADLGAEVTATETIIRLPGSILFDFAKAHVRPDAERTLLEVAGVLQAYGERAVRIEGHTDAIASEAYNLELSRRRAEAVRDWLVSHGIAAERLRTVGHGESRPVADNATAAGRQHNRRVEIVVETA